MPVVDGNYEQLTSGEIRRALEEELRLEFGEDIDLTESSVFTTLTESLATVLNENQEQSLEDVYNAAFLDTATGVNLDRVVSLIGLQRRSARNATGVQQFQASGPVSATYTIQRGTIVQTDGSDPIQFETTEQTLLQPIDSFEETDSLNDYTGDTGSASIVADSNAPNGSDVLELDATDGAIIYDLSKSFKQGTTFHCHVKPTANTVPTVVFGLDKDNTGTYYQIAVDSANGEVRVEYVTGSTVDTVIDSVNVGINEQWYELIWDWSITDNIGVTVNDGDADIATLGGDDSSITEGICGFKSGDANGTKRFDFYTTAAVSANIRALQGGTDGNVGPNSITSRPSPTAGVAATTNLYPTGTTTFTDRDGALFILGEDAETDEELRNRAQDTVTGGGDATHDAIVAELINDTEGVTSVTLFENKTDIDNTGSGGLPPYSFEAVVFGGEDEDVARTIFDKKAVTSRDYSGANGVSVTQTITAESNNQQRDIEFSRPSKVNVDVTLDLIIDDSYVGDGDIKDQVVGYIGGILSDETERVGLGVSENVVIDQITDIVVGTENGVVGLDQSVDSNPVETTPSTQTIDGLNVVQIGQSEVAQTDADNITINTRER